MSKKKESYAQEKLQRLMEEKGWVTKNMHGSQYQAGFPDLFCVHPSFGYRLVEVKMTWGSLTPAQRREFHRLTSGGASIWIAEIAWPINVIQIQNCIYAITHSRPNWVMYA